MEKKCLGCGKTYDKDSYRWCPHCDSGKEMELEKAKQQHDYFRYSRSRRW